MITAKIICDSYNEDFDSRITTFELEYPRFILAELNTHRCLVGASELVFDLPGNRNGGIRKFSMKIEDFFNKWTNGAERSSSHKIEYNLSNIESDQIYSAKEAAQLLSMKSVSNLRALCRSGRIKPQNPSKQRIEDYKIMGCDIVQHFSNKIENNFSIINRLKAMKLRMLNEVTNEIEHTTITDIWKEGTKPVYKLQAGDFSITATDDHMILTDSGWKELKDITTDDSIVYSAMGTNTPSDPVVHKKINGKWTSGFNQQVKKILSKEQDGKCKHCGSEDKLEVHHLEPVHLRPDLAFTKSNCIAVCNACHKGFFHKKAKYHKGTGLIGKYVKVTSISEQGNAEVYDLSVASEFHNFVCNDIVVHNCFSRSSASSRAIPIDKVIELLKSKPAMPNHWGKNQSGMQANEEIEDIYMAKYLWKLAAFKAIEVAEEMKSLGLHKQVVNRSLEPYQTMKTVVTSTGFNNFFWLRNHKDADPNIKELAERMQEAFVVSEPQYLYEGEWHLPYVISQRSATSELLYYDADLHILDLEDAKKISASCVAQTSYRKSNESLEKALMVYDKLVTSEPCHASPIESQATPIQAGRTNNVLSYLNKEGVTHIDKLGVPCSGNFHGWIQMRQLLPNNSKAY